MRSIATVDYHTAGEPFRIVSGGVSPLRGATVLDKRDDALARLDDVRKLLVQEPRGHADMYGCFVTPPDDDGAHLGAVFFHGEGYSTACGHGTIALVSWALEHGVLPITGEQTSVTLDVPSGRLSTVADVRDGRVRSVRFENVPSWVHSRGENIDLGDRSATVDISYGGAFYASLRTADLDLAVAPEHLPELIRRGRQIKAACNDRRLAEHPAEPRLSGCYGVIFVDELGPAHQRNVTVFADGEVDRSPCGSGTSARLALLDDDGSLPTGDVLIHDGILGTSFTGRVVERTGAGVITEVQGSAQLTGYHQFVLTDDDPLGTGFSLR